ncbi:MAG TPA: aspartyl protease family protein [Terriglobales bacterium]|jgi:hypothetical protein|nr:aspartyl protease family protein [Terriglobales bacterium]
MFASCPRKLFSLFVLFVSLPARAQTPTTQSVLDHWAAAIGGREKLQALHGTYSRMHIEIGGIGGTVQTWEATDGKRREETRLGSLVREDTIFDGQDGWSRNAQGKLRPLAGADLEEQVTNAFLASFSQFFTGRRSGRVEYAGEEGNTWVLRLLPEGGRAVTEYIDKITGLPIKEVQRVEDREQVLYIEDYRDVDGLKFASRARQVTGGDEKYAVRLTLDEVRLDPPLAAALFTKPPAPAPDVHFPAGAQSVTLPFEYYGNNIWVQVQVNGSASQWFIFDTGAEMSVLNAPRAARLGLKPKGTMEGRGVGEKSIDIGAIENVHLTLGATQLDPRPIMSADLSMVESFTGRPLLGILGYDTLSSYVFEIDYAARHLILHDPRTFRAAGKGAAVPFIFEGQVPIINASVTMPGATPIEGRFMVDTGDSSAVDFNAPFVKKHNLIDLLGNNVGPAAGFGVGGETHQVSGRLTKLTIGPFDLSNPVARFSQDVKGGGANPDQAGLIGGQVLSRFTVTFDYGNQFMYLKPNADLPKPFDRDMSGLVLTAEGPEFHTYRVYKVLDHSPAAEIGIQSGDVLVRLEGKPAADYTLDAIEELFLKPGKQYRLEIEREGKAIPLVLKTRRMI